MKKVLVFIIIFSALLFAQTKQTTVLTLNQAVNLALEKNADLKIASMEVTKSEEKLREARSGLFPNLDLSGQYQRYIDKPVIFLPAGSPLEK